MLLCEAYGWNTYDSQYQIYVLYQIHRRHTDLDEHGQRRRDVVQMVTHLTREVVYVPLDSRVPELGCGIISN